MTWLLEIKSAPQYYHKLKSSSNRWAFLFANILSSRFEAVGLRMLADPFYRFEEAMEKCKVVMKSICRKSLLTSCARFLPCAISTVHTSWLHRFSMSCCTDQRMPLNRSTMLLAGFQGCFGVRSRWGRGGVRPFAIMEKSPLDRCNSEQLFARSAAVTSRAGQDNRMQRLPDEQVLAALRGRSLPMLASGSRAPVNNNYAGSAA